MQIDMAVTQLCLEEVVEYISSLLLFLDEFFRREDENDFRKGNEVVKIEAKNSLAVSMG